MDTSVLDRHEKIALQFSGGKDSLAVLYKLRQHLDRITVYHLDTGDQFPETRQIVEAMKLVAPHFKTVQSNVHAWIAAHGLPSDLVPTTCSPLGTRMGFGAAAMTDRFTCCWQNVMKPMHEAMIADGITLVIRGTKKVDMPHLPASSGEVVGGYELFYPIEDWTHEEVISYLAAMRAPVSRVYEYMETTPECMACSAWWNDKRGAYLKKYHPIAFHEYKRRIDFVASQINPLVCDLAHELEE